MSGVKKATVSKSLNKTVSIVRAGVQDCAQAAQMTDSVGKEEFNSKKAASLNVHKGLKRELPDNVREFLEGETATWERLLRNHDKAFNEAGQCASEADGKETAFSNARAWSERRLGAMDAEIQAIRRSIEDKDWYCDEEDARAQQLRSEAQQILVDMRSNLELARSAQRFRRESFAKWTEADQLAQEAEREYNRLVNLANDRAEKKRIAEENKRTALILEADIKSLRGRIESGNWRKFGRECYTDSLRREADDVIRLISNGRYESVIPRAQEVKTRLSAAAEAVDAAERAWQAAKTAAEKSLADARAECGKMNRADMETYSGSATDAIAAEFARLETAARAISAESFDEASRLTDGAVAALRGMSEKTMENKRLAAQREEIAQSIMQALYDSEYDTPNYYLKDESDELSDLCVVAAAPGGVGDMKMRIAIAGEVSFEVANIPEGREQLCIDAIRKMQERLAKDEVRFDMTDWGRAENQNKVHLDVRPREREIQKTMQRHG